MKELIERKYKRSPTTQQAAEEFITVPTMEIGRTAASHLFTRRSTKRWRVKYSKGVVRTDTPHLDIVPFGFIDGDDGEQ